MYCKKCGSELKANECTNCGYVNNISSKATDYSYDLHKFEKAKKRGKVLYIILICILIFKLIGYVNTFVTFSKISNVTFWDTLVGINGVMLLLGLCVNIYLLFIVIKHWGLIFGSKKAKNEDSILVLVLSIFSILVLGVYIISTVLTTLMYINIANFDKNAIFSLAASTAINYIIKAGYIVAYFLYFGSIRQIEKSQAIGE